MGAYLHLGPVITLVPSTTFPCRLQRIIMMFCTDFSKLIEKCFRSWLRSEIESPTSLTYSELFREENRYDWFRSGALVNSWIKPVCGDFADRFYLKEARISMESFWVVLNLTCFVYILLPVWVVPFRFDCPDRTNTQGLKITDKWNKVHFFSKITSISRNQALS